MEPTLEPDPNFLALPHRQEPEPPFGLEFDRERAGVLNALPAEGFEDKVSEDVEGLLFVGYLTDDFEAYGHNFVIKTMKRGEKLAVTKLIADYESTIGLGDAISAASVAGCLMLVDGRALALPLAGTGVENVEQVIRRQFDIVQQWYDPVIDLVYDKYLALLRRQTQAFLDLQVK